GVVVFQVHHNVFRRPVLRYAPQTFRGPINVRLRVFRWRNIGPQAWRAHVHRGVDPSFAEGDGLFPQGDVGCIWAVLAVHRNVHDGPACLRHGGVQPFQIRLLERAKMGAPRLDFLDVEFGAYVGGTLSQLHFAGTWLVVVACEYV